MFCSTVIPTIGRPTLARAVDSVLQQSFAAAEFEVIVVNDSGRPLPGADWQRSDRVHVLHTDRRERSVARNTGAAIARGKYLHFLDDDDWLLPGGLKSLWQLARSSDAGWLHGGTQLVDRQGNNLIQLHHGMVGNCFSQVLAGEWIPLQSSLVEAQVFLAAGGFDPTIAGAEDIDLCRRIALRSDLAGTDQNVACVSMGREGSTTDYGRHKLDRRWAREKVLNEPGAFTRLDHSARQSLTNRSYWHGRVARVYLTSVVWNLQRRRPFTAGSRMAFGLTSLALAGRHLFAMDFWQALAKQYESFTFARGFQETRISD